MTDLFGVADAIFDWLSSLDLWLVCVLAAAFMMLETTALVGLVVPGDTVVMLAGATADSPGGYLAVVLAVSVGVLVGECGGYFLGRLVGPRLRYSRLGRRLGEHRWSRAEVYLAGRGAPALVPIRFVAAMHAVAPLIAGTVRMPLRRFLFWSALGTVLWSLTYVGVGVGVGTSYREYGAVVALATAVVAVVALGLLPLAQRAARLLVRRLRRSPAPAVHPAGTPPDEDRQRVPAP